MLITKLRPGVFSMAMAMGDRPDHCEWLHLNYKNRGIGSIKKMYGGDDTVLYCRSCVRLTEIISFERVVMIIGGISLNNRLRHGRDLNLR
jgi:hypothetical protein